MGELAEPLYTLQAPQFIEAYKLTRTVPSYSLIKFGWFWIMMFKESCVNG